MELSDDWRFLFPVSSVFAAPSAAADASRGPLHFSPVPPSTPLLSLPYPIPPPRSPNRRLDRLLRAFVRATSFLPRSDLDSLSGTQPSPSSSPPSNLVAVLHRPRLSSCSVLLFFPYGENAEHVAFVTLDATTVAASSPVSPVVQRDGFMHPGHRIQQLATTANESSWPSKQGDRVEGFLLAVTMYSLNWFKVESRDLGTPALVPAAKQRFGSVIVHACWSRHLLSECLVLLESGELCWFNLDTRQGGKMKIDLGSEDDCGDWLSCDCGAQPWMVIVASSKSILLIDLRFGDCGECKVLASVGMPGLFETDPFAGADQYLAFCRAGFDHFHFSVVTERHVILLDVRKPLTPVLAWQHALESPNNVAMFRLSELRPSQEHEWASNSGFAILVGSFWTGEFSVFCYGPKEQGCPENSHLYAWDLPSQFSVTSQRCSCSNGILEDVFSVPVSGDVYASERSKNPTIGYYVLPKDLSVSKTSFTGFVLICLKASGKLEMQRFRASASYDDIPCDESQHTARTSESSIFPDTACGNFPLRYSLIKLRFLSEYLEGNLCNALVEHSSSVNKQIGQIIVSEAVSEYAKDKSNSSSRSISDVLCNAKRSKAMECCSEGTTLQIDSVSDQCREVIEAVDPVISVAAMDNWPGSQELNDDEKPYFSYEPRIEHRFTLDGRAGKDKDQKLNDQLHTSATLYQSKIFTTFVFGKANVPDSGPEQAATSLFDFGPVRINFDTPGMDFKPADKKGSICLLTILMKDLPSLDGGCNAGNLRCNLLFFGVYCEVIS
ncbi:hypothetical protein HU200_021828 [Digitaria exilis]|uniref:Uncharacterized protein n=1 Tax=Digitaria exilis TaxID=1010633 RepID=A0A835EYX8_9POAL|nr:hypothetical protein HU200_021828 [Digitaria exilis]